MGYNYWSDDEQTPSFKDLRLSMRGLRELIARQVSRAQAELDSGHRVRAGSAGGARPAWDTFYGDSGFLGAMIQIVLAALATSVTQFGLEVHAKPSILRLSRSYLDGTIFNTTLQNLHLSLSVPVTHD
ncbi:hypothetical protein BJX66DRAFT_345914 [Aspergillus keveii]|uniref:Uncharacterized protein n=1 Tax=Aspergillus keveii TaxID=714993 RepID=A0ABR4FGI5_9EURO